MINNLFVPAILTKTKKNLWKRGYRIEDQMLREALEFAQKWTIAECKQTDEGYTRVYNVFRMPDRR